MKSALSAKVQDNKIVVLDELKLDAIKTKDFKRVMDNLKVSNALVVTDVQDQNVVMSAKNIPHVATSVAANINVYDIMKYKNLVVTKAAVASIEEVFA